jgi:hypothetical protein
MEAVIRSLVREVELERDFGSVKLSCSFKLFPINAVAVYLGSGIGFISPVYTSSCLCYIERKKGIKSSTKVEFVYGTPSNLNKGLIVFFIGTKN